MKKPFGIQIMSHRMDRLSGAVLTRGCVILVALGAVALCGCSAGARRDSDVAGQRAAAAGIVSPEQCEAQARIQNAALTQGYVIQPGDQLQIDFYLNPEFNENVSVNPNGKIALKMVGYIKAAGLSPTQLAQDVDHAYLKELRNPGAVVHVANMPGREIYVQGQVTKPGAFPLEPGMTLMQAIATAGGLTPDANQDAVVIRRDQCGVANASKVNLQQAVKNPSGGEDVALAPRDVVVVPRSGIANMDLWVKHYVKDLLPVQPYFSLTGPPL
ncbi:MAG: polysaccharide biosynthesis/export family protein [Candidatus Binataceae bacterium]